MRISVVVPNLHSPRIGDVVAALRRQTRLPDEIIVVGQDRYGLVHDDDLVRHIITPTPVAAARARNIGAREARGDYLLFVDADCIADSGLIENLAYQHQRGARVVGGSVQFDNNTYWALCDNLLAFAPFLVGTPPGSRPYLPSLNFSIERRLYERLGGFDESFAGAAGEDSDLSLRLREIGERLHFVPSAHVTHAPQRLSARTVWQHLRAYGRVHVKVERRHPSMSQSPLLHWTRRWTSSLVPFIPALAVLDVVRIFLVNHHVRRHPLALPGMVWAKMGWYIGVIEALYATSGDTNSAYDVSPQTAIVASLQGVE